MEKIIVSSNCQTGGIAATLKKIFPNQLIKPIFTPDAKDENATNAFLEELKDASIWITQGRFQLAQGLNVKVVKVPGILFSAFHPDIIYAQKSSTGELTKVHYNSQIAIWSYKNQIDTSDAARLFKYSTFKALGYFNRWTSSVEQLKNLFIQNDLNNKEFNKFFLAIKRKGVFMHTINHPRAETVVELGKLIASKLGAAQSILNREIVIPDGLLWEFWPLYPEIGQELGLRGNYRWSFGNLEIEGIKSYLDFAYQNYSEQGIMPSDLIPASSIPNMDNVLTAELKNK